MRKVVVYELLSLDGVAEAPDRFITTWDDVMDENLARVIATQDAVILGRRSFEEWARYWPESEIEPFASFINAVDKYVVTASPLKLGWAHAAKIEGDLLDFVRDLKERDGGDIGVHASISVARALLDGGVVDELRLVIAPRVVGDGRRLLEELAPGGWALLRCEASPSGALLLDYQVSP